MGNQPDIFLEDKLAQIRTRAWHHRTNPASHYYRVDILDFDWMEQKIRELHLRVCILEEELRSGKSHPTDSAEEGVVQR